MIRPNGYRYCDACDKRMSKVALPYHWKFYDANQRWLRSMIPGDVKVCRACIRKVQAKLEELEHEHGQS